MLLNGFLIVITFIFFTLPLEILFSEVLKLKLMISVWVKADCWDTTFDFPHAVGLEFRLNPQCMKWPISGFQNSASDNKLIKPRYPSSKKKKVLYHLLQREMAKVGLRSLKVVFGEAF